MLLVLAALGICVGYVCVWYLTGTWSYVLAICVCVVLDRHLVVCVGYMCVCVVLNRHLVCLVLAALWLYVKWGAWRGPDARGECVL